MTVSEGVDAARRPQEHRADGGAGASLVGMEGCDGVGVLGAGGSGVAGVDILGAPATGTYWRLGSSD